MSDMVMKLKYIVLLNYVPNMLLLFYVMVNIYYIICYNSFIPNWFIYLLLLCLIYTLREMYLDGYESINIAELDTMGLPTWLKWLDTAVSIDGYVKIKRRMLYYVYNNYRKWRG